MNKNVLCYCGSEKSFENCCGLLLKKKKQAQTPEELMRSRYSAYVLGDGAYIVDTTTKENRFLEDIALIEEFCNNVQWLKLDVLHVEQNGINGVVEFKAYYLENGEILLQHERSSFVQNEGQWEYEKGSFINSKIERNELCPCGSGKKFKKCKEHLL